VCSFFFSSLFIIQFSFFMVGVYSVQGLCWFIPGVAVGILVLLICSPVGLLDVSQEGLELASCGMGSLLFSQCNAVWRSFVQAVGSRCRRADSSWCFFPAKVGCSVSEKFLIYGTHIVCFAF
jgi:hypothetical protein